MDKNRSRGIDTALHAIEKAIRDKEQEAAAAQTSGGGSFSMPMEQLITQGLGAFQGPYSDIQRMIEEHKETIRGAVDYSTEKIREKPWTFLGLVALGGVGIGMILASRNKTSQKETCNE